MPDERIVLTFKFHWDAEDTLLTLTFRDADGGGTALRLEHERITLSPPLDGQSVDNGRTEAANAKLQTYFDPDLSEEETP